MIYQQRGRCSSLKRIQGRRPFVKVNCIEERGSFTSAKPKESFLSYSKVLCGVATNSNILFLFFSNIFEKHPSKSITN